jgi:hypothetical protein
MLQSKRYLVESKEDMKKRLGYSPDYMDAVAVLCDVARHRGLVATNTGAKLWTSPKEDQIVEDVLNNEAAAPMEATQYAGGEY